MECISCGPGADFKNFRCINMYPNVIDTYSGISNYCDSKNSSMIEFFTDQDLYNCIETKSFQAPGYYVIK